MRNRLNYYRRIAAAYLTMRTSQLTFWHENPTAGDRVSRTELGAYYMPFAEKAEYSGHLDARGIPLLDYHGRIGRQYNPIAIAQFGLGNYNQFLETGTPAARKKFLIAAEWLMENLLPNAHGIPVWHHNFDWDYRTTLKAPWYSGLAQGQGISLLVRVFQHTGDVRYLNAAKSAFRSILTPVDKGGVALRDNDGNLWFEEYLVDPPTHILNGFIWAAWGVYDYFLATKDISALVLFGRAVQTLKEHLQDYDTGWWSLYEQSGTRMRMLASPFYHRLHVAQLAVMHRLTGQEFFAEYAQRWRGYERNRLQRTRALIHKSAFKLLYY